MTTLDRADIQGNILRGYTFRHASHLVFTVVDAERARAFLRTLEVTSATPWPAQNRPDRALNVAFSHAGLAALARSEDARADGPRLTRAVLDQMGVRFPEFKEGMLARAEQLGDDPAVEGRDQWRDAHVLVSVFTTTSNARDERAGQMVRAAEAGLRLTYEQRTDAIVDEAKGRRAIRREHFGFADDISNPEIEGAYAPGEARSLLHLGNAKPDGHGQFRPIRAGEFLLGHMNESGEMLNPGPLRGFVQNGTFAAVRVLEQHVEAFRTFLESKAKELGCKRDDVGAMIVGRRLDGTPLACTLGGETLNDYGYAGDRDGTVCPHAAHVRRTNPRDASGIVDVTHRIVRRGMPYGPKLDDLPVGGAKVERGLFFVALNSDLGRQFEFIQRQWVNKPTGTSGFDDYDPLIGAGDGAMVVPGQAPGALPRVIKLEAFVTCRGGGYFFLPSMSALRAISNP